MRGVGAALVLGALKVHLVVSGQCSGRPVACHESACTAIFREGAGVKYVSLVHNAFTLGAIGLWLFKDVLDFVIVQYRPT